MPNRLFNEFEACPVDNPTGNYIREVMGEATSKILARLEETEGCNNDGELLCHREITVSFAEARLKRSLAMARARRNGGRLEAIQELIRNRPQNPDSDPLFDAWLKDLDKACRVAP